MSSQEQPISKSTIPNNSRKQSIRADVESTNDEITRERLFRKKAKGNTPSSESITDTSDEYSVAQTTADVNNTGNNTHQSDVIPSASFKSKLMDDDLYSSEDDDRKRSDNTSSNHSHKIQQKNQTTPIPTRNQIKTPDPINVRDLLAYQGFPNPTHEGELITKEEFLQKEFILLSEEHDLLSDQLYVILDRIREINKAKNSIVQSINRIDNTSHQNRNYHENQIPDHPPHNKQFETIDTVDANDHEYCDVDFSDNSNPCEIDHKQGSFQQNHQKTQQHYSSDHQECNYGETERGNYFSDDHYFADKIQSYKQKRESYDNTQHIRRSRENSVQNPEYDYHHDFYGKKTPTMSDRMDRMDRMDRIPKENQRSLRETLERRIASMNPKFHEIPRMQKNQTTDATYSTSDNLSLSSFATPHIQSVKRQNYTPHHQSVASVAGFFSRESNKDIDYTSRMNNDLREPHGHQKYPKETCKFGHESEKRVWSISGKKWIYY